MSEKILKGRLVQKHDTAENWSKATSFIPKQGEVIVYDIDENYDYERMKIGDGKTLVSSLPFIAAETATEADHAISADTATKADSADSATKDASGNIITDTYATKTELGAVSSLVGDTAVSEQIAEATEGFVSYSAAQELTKEQKIQVKSNLDPQSRKWVYFESLDLAVSDDSFMYDSTRAFDIQAVMDHPSAANPSRSALEILFTFLDYFCRDIASDASQLAIWKSLYNELKNLYEASILSTTIYASFYDSQSRMYTIMVSDINSNNVRISINGERKITGYYSPNTETLNIASYECAKTTDKNLTIKNYPADAKAVGDALALKADKTALDEAIAAIPQSDWNQNDETAADYVLNKTHYEYVEYGDTLAWDGNTEGLESDASGTLFLVSDITPTIEDFQNGHAMKIDTEVEEWVVNSVIEDNGTLTNDTGLFFVVYEDNTTIEWTSFPKKGIYFSGSAQNPMARLAAPTVEYLRINGYNGFSTTTLKQLDEKFIPDSIARKEYVDTKFSTLVGDTPVSEQINNAIQPMTIEEIDAICAMDDIEALVIAEYLSEATDSEGNTLTDNQDNTYVF